MKIVKIKQILLSMAVIGLLIFFHFIGFLKPVEKIFSSFLNPVMGSVYNFSSFIRTKYNEQTSKIDLWGKVSQLEAEVNLLTVKNAELSTMESENKILRDHLNFLTEKKYNNVISNVISRGDISDISDRTETIIIDKGINDGVFIGMPVLSSQGIIIGKISEAKEKISKVNLTNNINCKLAATVINQQKTSGITEGELGLTIKMGFISQSDIIKKGDIIITSGLEKSIPRGLVIGKVVEVNKESNELWQTATIEPMLDPDELIIVSILLP
jgi:rod shape-determining protein MreC